MRTSRIHSAWLIERARSHTESSGESRMMLKLPTPSENPKARIVLSRASTVREIPARGPRSFSVIVPEKVRVVDWAMAKVLLSNSHDSNAVG